jgi:RNA polymerase sigma-54 factor
MRFTQDFRLLQAQRLVITPELRQAIKILRLPSLELGAYLQEQVLQNPLLELADETGNDEPEASDSIDEGTAEGAIAEREAADEREAQGPESLEDWVEYFQDSSDLGYLGPREHRSDLPVLVETIPAETATLAAHLLLQLHVMPLDAEVIRAVEALIEALDQDGYLRSEPGAVAVASGIEAVMLEDALAVLQQMDPPGVGARDLQECLLLQLASRGMGDSLASRIVSGHLEDLAASRLVKIAASTGQSLSAVQAAVDLIRGLEPRPGAAFNGPGDNRYVVPDVVVEGVEGEYVVVLNESAVPRLRLSPFYRRLAAESRHAAASGAAGSAAPGDQLAQDEAGRQAAEFVNQRLRSAIWLLRCLEQRRSTVHRVVESIVRQQRDFFDQGVRYLHPLTLRDVASDVGVHESTVSRAIAGKYVQTPKGTFALRFFFGSGLSAPEGGQVSSTSVKQVIRELIEAEDAHRPHSDQRIVELLKQRGARLSRRTVTKYRQELGLPSSTRRRRY